MWLNLGYPAVMFFFVLSGYVIGLVTTEPATPARIRHYLFHRAGRLLPVNICVVLVSWLLVVFYADWRTVAGNLLFLQNSDPYPVLGVFPLLVNNPNLWSLNYEVVFYLGFIAVWLWTPRVSWVFGAVALVVCAHALGFSVAGIGVPRVVARWACGALFWLAGLTVAWMTAQPETPVRRSNWLAAVLGAYALWMFSPLRTLFLHWNFAGWIWPNPTPMSPHRLDFLPGCLWLLLAVTGRAPRVQRWLAGICLTLATAGLIGRLLSGTWQGGDSVSALVLLAAGATLRIDYDLGPLQRLAPLGAVSFALYAIGVPLQIGQRVILPGFSGSPLTFAVRLAFVVAIVAAAVWLLERRLCPPIGRWIRRWGDPADGPRN